MSQFQTPQEEFWAGSFGSEYTERNQGAHLIASNIALFSKVLAHTNNISSIIEFGANTGLNLQALKKILPNAELSGLEINTHAANTLKALKNINVYHQSIFNFAPDYQRDFVLSKGVLIHINPDLLPKMYELLYQTSKKYICIAEYYNPSPVTISYRGHTEKLFKRDFAGELLNTYKDLKLINYGFVYHGDKNFPQDDLTWFLLEK